MGCRLKTGSILCLQETETMKRKGAVIVHDEEELMNELGKYDTEQIYIIGGESVYKMMLSYCDKNLCDKKWIVHFRQTLISRIWMR